MFGDAKERMKDSKRGKKASEEHRKRISESLKKAYAEGRR